MIHGLEEITDSEKAAARLTLYEKLLTAMGRIRQKRIYMLDGDRRNIGPLLEKRSTSGEHLNAFFTPGREMENLFLERNLICGGLRAQLKLYDLSTIGVEESRIDERLRELLDLGDNDPRFSKLFPSGRPNDRPAIDSVKGSRLLTEIYRDFELPYEKNLSGRILAKECDPSSERLHAFVKPMVELIRQT